MKVCKLFYLFRPIRTALTSPTSGYGTSISGFGTPMPMKSPAVNRAIASHRRALSVRSKASSIDGKRKRYSEMGFRFF